MIEYNFDAKGKKIGRLATEIATILMGKNTPDYAPNRILDVKVMVSNIDKMSVDQKKLNQKEYDRYSGYPGGRKVTKLSKLVEDKGWAEVLKNAVHGMLPKNKLRPLMMKNLIIE